MLYRALAAIVLAVIATPAGAREPLRLEPSSKWNIDYGNERCSLMREFGTADAAVHLQIDSFGSWNQFRVLLSGPAVPHLGGPTGMANVSRTGDPRPSPVRTLQGTSGKVNAVSFDLAFVPYISPAAYRHMTDYEKEDWETRMSRPQPDYDATVDSLSIQPGRGTNLVLNVGNMAAPLAAMRTCIDDMYKSWGMDPVQQRGLSKWAHPTKGTVRKVQADYPLGALMTGTSAYVPVRLTIDADGTTSACVVQAENVDKAFRAAACEHLRSEFKPALDADGKPVASIYHTSVIYVMGAGWE
jgi:hypothetical protein